MALSRVINVNDLIDRIKWNKRYCLKRTPFFKKRGVFYFCYNLANRLLLKVGKEVVKMKLFKMTKNEKHNTKQLNEAASLLRDGHVVAFPTETVYGLGANALDERAISKIFTAKGRPADNPLIVHVATKEQMEKLVTHLPDYVEKLIEMFSPGPLTYVLRHNGKCAKNVTAGLSTVAVRIPDHKIALSLINKSDLPIAAPSANISGKPSPTVASHVQDDLAGKISALVDGGKTGIGVESTVIDCTGDFPIILRHGGVTKEQLEEFVDVIDMVDLGEKSEKQPKSPGMKYKHYAPDIPLILVTGSVAKIKGVIKEKQLAQLRVALLAKRSTIEKIEADKKMSLGESEEEAAQNLYRSLRLLSKENVDYIVCEGFSKTGVGQAIMDRLERAATYIINDQ